MDVLLLFVMFVEKIFHDTCVTKSTLQLYFILKYVRGIFLNEKNLECRSKNPGFLTLYRTLVQINYERINVTGRINTQSDLSKCLPRIFWDVFQTAVFVSQGESMRDLS